MTPKRATPNQARGILELAEWFAPDTRLVEVGSYLGESAELFLQSGRVAHVVCVDPWCNAMAPAEREFDQMAARWPGRVTKLKLSSLDAAGSMPAQSFDACYIDANHNYPKISQDLAAWRCKVRAGGWLAGHDYSHAFPGVVQAVGEQLGYPERVFSDSSWLVQAPAQTYQIVTYCSANFWPCLQLTLPTWLEQSGARQVVVYVDSPGIEQALTVRDVRVVVRQIHQERCVDPVESWDRKIDVCQDAWHHCPDRWYLWLDSDCLVTRSLRPLFEALGPAQIGATRAIGRTARGRGQANAGVIPFQHHGALFEFFHAWRQRTQHLRKTQPAIRWHEQTAFSQLALDAFDGLLPYRAAVVSENLWNCEHDVDADWLAAVARYKPAIIHCKSGRWRKPELMRQVRA